MLTGPRRPAHSEPATALIVLLHGYGADGEDLIALADVLGPSLPFASFIALHAPDAGPMGGRQWFPLMRLSLEECATGVASAGPTLSAALHGLLVEQALPPARLALVGFSQGTMMALHVGLTLGEPIAAIVGFSGLLAADLTNAQPVPTLLVHGTADEVLPANATVAAAHNLAGRSVPVEWHLIEGLGHGIEERGLTMARDHLVRHLPPLGA